MQEHDATPAPSVLAAALEHLPAEVVIADHHGRIISVNEGWRHFGLENGAPKALCTGVGVNYLDVCSGATAAASPLAREAFEGLSAVLAGRRTEFQLEYPCHSDTENRWFLMNAVPFAPLNGLLIMHFDITRRKESELMLWDAAQHDPLTGVFNRRGITELARHLERTGPATPYPLVVAADVEGLKFINDNFGHASGDLVIRAAARSLSVRRAVVARLGGDEFLALLPRKAPRYRQAFESSVQAAFRRECGKIRSGLSLGFAQMPEDGATLEELASVADRRMYEGRFLPGQRRIYAA